MASHWYKVKSIDGATVTLADDTNQTSAEITVPKSLLGGKVVLDQRFAVTIETEQDALKRHNNLAKDILREMLKDQE